jgi:hypothetical protein
MEVLMGQAFAKVIDYITNEEIQLIDFQTLITILKTVFEDPDSLATAEGKLELLKQTNNDFSTDYVDIHCYVTNF